MTGGLTGATPGGLTVLPVMGLPEVRPGDDLVALIAGAVAVVDGDVVVVAQKVVSKAEGALVDPPPAPDPATARRQLAADHAVRVVADAPRALIVETAHGLVCANAGIDASNVPGGQLTLLPADPDASARRLRDGLKATTGARVAVIIADTFGRPWRVGQTDVAIGVAGLAPLRDDRGGVDREGLVLEATLVAVADELAGAADLVRGKASGVPVVVVRGFAHTPDDVAAATALLRLPAEDLFPRGRGGLADALASPPSPVPVAGPVDPADLARALRVVDAMAAGAATAELAEDGAGATLLRVSATDPVHAGLAAGALTAALVDLGYEVVARPQSGSGLGSARHGAVVAVHAGQSPRPRR